MEVDSVSDLLRYRVSQEYTEVSHASSRLNSLKMEAVFVCRGVRGGDKTRPYTQPIRSMSS